MHNYIRYFLVIVVLFIVGHSWAQDPETELIRKYAESGFESGDYEFALENYLKLYDKNKEDININFRLGVCYTKTHDNKTGGIPHLEFVVSHNNFPTDAFFYLGQSYMFAYRFTEAVEALYEYKISGLDDELISRADHLVTMSYAALEFINQPIKVDFYRLDSTVNTAMNDFNPFVSVEDEKLFFTSNYRYIDELEININDIYTASGKDGEWKEIEFWEENTYENEETVGISNNGDNLIIYSNGDFSTHDLSLVEIKRRGLERKKKGFPANKINTRDFEHGATINNEGNVIYFASDRPGGFGGLDIYMIKKDEDDKWGEPENLGAVVNTEYDENFPVFARNSKNFYFSSNGHRGLGGYDLFEAIYNPEKEEYALTRNLGVPVNTPYDEMSISWEEDGRAGYMARNRKEGLGKLDIYRIEITPDTKNTIISGTIMVGEEGNSVPYSDEFNKVFVTLYDKFGNIYARYPVEGNTFFANIPPGEYKLEIYLDGSDFKYTEDLRFIESGEDQFQDSKYYIKQ